MIIQTKCKMCGKIVSAYCDDDCPAENRDKLVPLLTCDRCYDYRHNRQKVIERLRHISIWMQTRSLDKEDLDKLRERAQKDLHRFTELVAAYRHCPTVYDDHAIDSFMDHPNRLSSILKHLTFAIKPEPKLL